ncbi:MAG: EAL domain-containing protein [Rhodocyclales bacterium]|nr:EAL domain-containing protein [Rhodocyclales bacterium]
MSVIVTGALVMLLGWLVFSFDQYRSVTRLLGEQHAAAVEAAYRASSRMYRISAGIMFRGLSRHPAVIDWLEESNDADEEELARFRDWFLRLLRPEYMGLRDEGFRQFQIHLADGRVLLRYHAPDEFDAALFVTRPAVALAHLERRTVVGFEASGSGAALRHIFPVVYEDRLLGSFDLSVPFRDLQEQLVQVLPDNDFLLLLRRDGGAPQAGRIDFPLHGELVIAQRELADKTRGFVESVNGRAVLAALAQRPEMGSLDEVGAHVAVPLFARDSAYFASLLPVLGVTGKGEGWMLAIRNAPELGAARFRFVAQGVVGATGIVLLGVVLGLLLVVARRRKLQELQARALNAQLTMLIETLPDAVYFKDADGRWLVVNRPGLSWLGLEKVDWRGKTNTELAEIQPQYRDALLRADAQDREVLAAGELRVYEDEEVHADGPHRYEVRKLPHVEQGHPVSIVIVRRDVTDEAEAKRRVIESERRYRDVVDNIKEVIFRTDRDGCVTFLNPAWESLTAYPVERTLGRQSIDYVHPDDRARFRSGIRPLLRQELDSLRMELRYLRADGGYCWMEVYARLSLDDKGRIDGVYGTLMDVSERRQILMALRAERDLFAAGPAIAFMWRNEPGWPIDYVSSNVVAELGYTPEEMMSSGFCFASLIHPDDIDRVVLEGGKHRQMRHPSYELVYRLRHRTNGYRWFHDYSVPQFKRGHEGAPARISGYLLDQTAAMEAQLALEQGRQRLAWILEGSDVGTWEWDIAGGVFSINDRWAAMLGYTLEELGPLTTAAWRSLIHPDDSDTCIERLRQHFAGQVDYYEVEYRMRHKNGGWQWVLMRGQVLSHAEDGEPELMCGTQMDIARRKSAEAHAAHLAYYDELTGLPNRRMLFEKLRHAQASSSRSNHIGALLFIDLDNFKNLNDTLGHDYGDLLLMEVGARLQRVVRAGDTVARLGGDEFVLLFEELSANEDEALVNAQRVVQKVLATLSVSCKLNQFDYHITPSIGVTLFRDGSESAETLMKNADLAMYQAKAAGKGTYCFFDPAMQATAERRRYIEVELRRAQELGQLALAYQPILDVTGKVVAVEALVRWRHPEHGMISPGEFVPVAEKSGLIVSLGRWVLHTACAQLAHWHSHPARAGVRIAVNVSAVQFHQQDFVDQVLEVLRETGADGRRLRLEITESMLVENIEETIARMTVLRAAGVSFSLDDFGTGYSSLNYLKRLPLSVLKIDQSFVHDIEIDPNDAAIVQTIIAMAHSLGLRVVAEGVETEGQRAYLLAHGCDQLQGFLLYRPMGIDALEDALG